MRKVLFPSFLLIISSCTKDLNSKPLNSEDSLYHEQAMATVDSAVKAAELQASAADTHEQNPRVLEARKLIDQASEWMEKGIRKEITVGESNKKINPLMAEFQKINSTLSAKEQKDLENYRVQRMQKSIDLQIQYSE